MSVERLIPLYSGEAVFLSVIFVYLGGYIAISLCEQLRLSSVMKNQSKLLGDKSIVFIMSLSMAGIGIWCMHFVGMSAMTLRTADGIEIHLMFSLFETVMSLITVVVLLYVGLFIGARDVVYCKTKVQIIEMFIGQTSKLTFKQIQGLKNGSTIAYLIGTKSLSHLITGGMLAATGIVVMHYLGMYSIIFPGIIKYNIGMVTASIIIAIIGCLCAFWTLFRLLSIYPQTEYLRVGCALFLTAAKCGMHYVGMQSAEFYYDPEKANQHVVGIQITAENALMAAIIASLIFVCILITIIMADLRSWLNGFTVKMKASDDFVKKLQKALPADMPLLLTQYAKRREAAYLLDRAFQHSSEERIVSQTSTGSKQSGGTAASPRSRTSESAAKDPVEKLTSHYLLGGRPVAPAPQSDVENEEIRHTEAV